MNINNSCECGCGFSVRSGNRFMHGHNRVGERLSEETKKKIRENHKGMLGKHHSEKARKK